MLIKLFLCFHTLFPTVFLNLFQSFLEILQISVKKFLTWFLLLMEILYLISKMNDLIHVVSKKSIVSMIANVLESLKIMGIMIFWIIFIFSEMKYFIHNYHTETIHNLKFLGYYHLNNFVVYRKYFFFIQKAN